LSIVYYTPEKNQIIKTFTSPSDSSGHFKVDVPGDFEHKTLATGIAMATDIVAETQTEMGIEEAHTHSPIRLAPKIDARVRLLDDSDKPIPNETLSVSHLMEGQRYIGPIPPSWDVKTDSDGYATFNNLSRAYQVHIAHKDDRYADISSSDFIDLTVPTPLSTTEFHLTPGGSISGSVFYAPGHKPATNQQLEVTYILSNMTSETYIKTDSKGFYKLPRLAEGVYKITTSNPASSEWVANSMLTISVRRGQNLTNQNISISHGAMITGKVIAKDGAPVSSVYISLSDATNRRWIDSWITDKNGIYNIRVPAGKYLVGVESSAYSYPQGLAIVTEGQTKKLDFSNPQPSNATSNSPQYTINCIVRTPDGQPAANASIGIACSVGYSSEEETTVTDSNGKANMQTESLDDAFIYAAYENMAVKTFVPLTKDKTDYDITLSPASELSTLSGSVVDENGKPITGASVSMSGTIKMKSGATLSISSSNTISDNDGKFRFIGLTADQGYQVNISKTGFIQTTIERAIKGKEDALLDPIKLIPATSFVAGKLVNTRGKPIAGAIISCNETNQHVMTDANGAFRINNVNKGSVNITYCVLNGQAVQASIESDNSDVVITVAGNQNIDPHSILKSGTIAPDFTAKDLSDRTITLSKLKGKVVVLDFWDSSDMQSMVDLPNVIDVYKKYHQKGVVVIGFALDKDKQALVTAIHQNKIDFSQVYYPKLFDSNGLATPILHLYKVSTLPLCIVIGKDGRIVASNLSGADVEQAVIEALGVK
jgi:peroxiredoxin